MKLDEYISNESITLSLTDSVKKAISKTKDQRVSHFPIIENKKLFGCISESDLSTFAELDKAISDFQYTFESFFATEHDNLIELITLFSLHETNILPLINDDKKYVGYYELSEILSLYADSPYIKEEGVILILEKNNTSYSISEIAQISETHNATIYGLHISNKSGLNTQITIKIKTNIIDDIIQSYRRYEYNIVSKHEDDSYLEDLKNRSNYLQKYLNI
jgi:CBS domain-containing protein